MLVHKVPCWQVREVLWLSAVRPSPSVGRRERGVVDAAADLLHRADFCMCAKVDPGVAVSR